jgi:type IV pilus assembly protein PilB
LTQLGKTVDLDHVLNFLKEEKIIQKNATWESIPFYKPKKSSESEDGFKGRVGIHEVLKVTPTIRELIMQGKTSRDIEEQAKKEGMMTMIEDGIFKAVEGKTTIEEVLRVVSE